MKITSYEDLRSIRLQNQLLTSQIHSDPTEIVSHLGAMQAQDYHAAKWSLGLRTKNSTDLSIEDAIDNGKILRTHMMRPTWHFVTPEDIYWIQNLTSAHVLKQNNYMTKKLELDTQILIRCEKIITKSLEGNNFQTRQQLSEILEKNKIPAKGQRLAYIIMHAELSSLIASGPRIGKQFSYALLSERAPKIKKLSTEESLATLALKYFQSHGPAQIRDFAWWSGLGIIKSQIAIQLLKSKLTKISYDQKEYYVSGKNKSKPKPDNKAFLLSIFDEYTIAYNDRSALGNDTKIAEKLIMMGNALTAVIILNGQIAGTWKKAVSKNNLSLNLNLFQKLNSQEKELIKSASEDFGKFMNSPITTKQEINKIF